MTPHTTPTTAPTRATAGHRRAAAAARPGRRLRLLPSAPVLAGVAALAVTVGGAVSGSLGTEVVEAGPAQAVQIAPVSAMSGSSRVASQSMLNNRQAAVSRDSRRDAMQATTSERMVKKAEGQAQQREAAMSKLAAQAQTQAAKIARNAWVLPVHSYSITNTFGVARGYYSSGYHTGLDFNTVDNAPIYAIANGEITETGYDGAYGNKTVLTLDDGTEIWFCHQSSIVAEVGQFVHAGDLIGHVGDTGNSFGSHLHIEVRPGAGDPVDPFDAFVVHGITP